MPIPSGTPKRIFFPLKDDDPFTLLEGQWGIKLVASGSRAYYRPIRDNDLDPIPDPILIPIDDTLENAVGEVPAGTIDGVNKVFTTSKEIQNQATTIVTLNGIKQKPITDYTTSGTTITFVGAPAVNSEIYVVYNILLSAPPGTPDVAVVDVATFTASVTNRILLVDRTATGACAITVSTALIALQGVELLIKDTGAGAGAFNINIVGEAGEPVDGDSAGVDIVADRGFVRLLMAGDKMEIVGRS
jgi:hypothetical protein